MENDTAHVDRLPVHSGSHRRLLAKADPPEAIAQKVDAVIVPSARPASYLRHAIDLATQLRCYLVVLCSRQASAADTLRVVSSIGIDVVAIDLPDDATATMPRLETSELVRETPYQRVADIWVKRNLGLLLARAMAWSGVVFLDDDIYVADATDLRRAVGLLSRFDGVGLSIDGFPDNSVVCHAYRKTGGRQDTFVGGGALAVAAHRTDSFFPAIYNEDWFFLLGDARLRPVAVTGSAAQQPYDPFADPAGAAMQEFGDVLAEGVFSLLDRGRRVRDADGDFWQAYLGIRGRLIRDVLRRLKSAMVGDDERARIEACLGAARQTLQGIEPGLCVEFLRRWRRDRTRWRNSLSPAGGRQELDVALKALGLTEVSRVHRCWDPAQPGAAL